MSRKAIFQRLIPAILLLLSFNLSAQAERPKNNPYADLKRFHLGFHVGLFFQDMKIANNGSNNLYAQMPSYGPGFAVGIIANSRISRYLDWRIDPTFYFGESIIAYSNGKQRIFQTTLRTSALRLPLLLKYSSRRLNNYRPYVVGGLYGDLQLGRKKGEPILLKMFDAGITVGLGCDIYLRYFKFCPELQVSFGLPNILEKRRSDLLDERNYVYTSSIRFIHSHAIMLTFNFE